MLAFYFFAAAILYVLAGYPVILGWLAKRRARPVTKAPQRLTVAPDDPRERVKILVSGELVIVLAALCAGALFCVPPQTLWKETKVA
jgi:hypothetical protein